MKKRPSVSESSARSKADSTPTASRAAQRQRIGQYLLANGHATTIDLRDACNAMHPAGRIKEMRATGWPIETAWTWTVDHEGRPHRCGLYFLTRPGVHQ